MTPFELAHRFVGEIKEVPGEKDHPLIQWWLSLCEMGFDQHDEVAWCSAFVNGMEWELRLKRSKSAAARSNLLIGEVVPTVQDAKIGYDVAILQRGTGPQPGPEVIHAQGHVGFFAGYDAPAGLSKYVYILGGNQGNGISIERFPVAQLLGIRRVGG